MKTQRPHLPSGEAGNIRRLCEDRVNKPDDYDFLRNQRSFYRPARLSLVRRSGVIGGDKE